MSDTNTILTNVTHQLVRNFLQWLVGGVIKFIRQVGFILCSHYHHIDFCMAQNPSLLRGLVILLVLASFGIFGVLISVLHGKLKDIKIGYMTVSEVMIVWLVLFVFVSKWHIN